MLGEPFDVDALTRSFFAGGGPGGPGGPGAPGAAPNAPPATTAAATTAGSNSPAAKAETPAATNTNRRPSLRERRGLARAASAVRLHRKKAQVSRRLGNARRSTLIFPDSESDRIRASLARSSRRGSRSFRNRCFRTPRRLTGREESDERAEGTTECLEYRAQASLSMVQPRLHPASGYHDGKRTCRGMVVAGRSNGNPYRSDPAP